jgi:hypothetical protein
MIRILLEAAADAILLNSREQVRLRVHSIAARPDLPGFANPQLVL